MLTSLDLAGIPLMAHERGDHHPLVVMGGHAAFNPEPVADFVDAVVLGDGEEAVLAISEIVSAFKAEHPAPRRGRQRHVAAPGPARAPGRPAVVYVPAFYDVEYLADGRIGRVVPTNSAAPWRVAKHTLMDLDEWPYPKNPLVPLAETVHERLSVEIFRGCTRGCRFCQAGMITRPVRERSTEVLGDDRDDAAQDRLRGGRDALAEQRGPLGDRFEGLADRYESEQVALSLPSTRVDAFNIDLANELRATADAPG